VADHALSLALGHVLCAEKHVCLGVHHVVVHPNAVRNLMYLKAPLGKEVVGVDLHWLHTAISGRSALEPVVSWSRS
jgi:hypothetical protein